MWTRASWNVSGAPPGYPAEFTRHDAAEGGRSEYTMTGPDGDVSHCYWQWLAVEPHTSIEVLEGFATADSSPDAQMPSMRMTVAFETTQAGSRTTTTTHFNNVNELATLVDMGMEEGMRHSMEQMGEVLADLRSFSADLPVTAQILSDTKVRISRLINGSVDAVWRAHHEKELLQQWLLGPEGWSMPGKASSTRRPSPPSRKPHCFPS